MLRDEAKDSIIGYVDLRESMSRISKSSKTVTLETVEDDDGCRVDVLSDETLEERDLSTS